MLKKYDELTEEEKKKVTLMYSDKDTVQMYLYNFDEHGNYHGRQYIPPVGLVHAESTVKDVPERPKPNEHPAEIGGIGKSKKSKKK